MNKLIKDYKSGFTIVELLIVIVVIGILAAITIVAYTGITTQANKSAAAQNASAVGSAADAYYAYVGSYPAISGTTLNLTNSAIPSGSSITLPGNITVLGATGDLDASISNNNVMYVLNSGSTGYCLGYYPVGGTTNTLGGGSAAGTLTNPTTATTSACS